METNTEAGSQASVCNSDGRRLTGENCDADVRIEVASSLPHEGLASLAHAELISLKRDSLSKQQLLSVLLLEAEAHIELGRAAEALKPLRELIVRDPNQAATAQTRLLLEVLTQLKSHYIARGGTSQLFFAQSALGVGKYDEYLEPDHPSRAELLNSIKKRSSI